MNGGLRVHSSYIIHPKDQMSVLVVYGVSETSSYTQKKHQLASFSHHCKTGLGIVLVNCAAAKQGSRAESAQVSSYGDY